MFSYVAKSLLSKTLQTFLRKYLENIELESIDFGSSTSSSADAGTPQKAGSGSSGSGWGVRLSNVKLREGMELMKLPGKRKRVITRKKKVKRSKACNDTTPEVKNTRRKEKKSEGTESSVSDVQPGVSGGASVDSRNTIGTQDRDSEKDGILLHRVELLPVREQLPNQDSYLSSGSETDGYFSSSPPTPTQNRSSICGVPSTFCVTSNSRGTATESQQKKTAVNEVLLPFNEDILSGNGQEKLLPRTHTSNHTTSFGENNLTGQANITPPASPTRRDCNEHELSREKSHGDANASDDDSFVEVEEEFTVEDELDLLVGAGGVIGTLNIRVVDKELHITVEDANLIFEAVPRELAADEGSGGESKNDEVATPQSNRTKNLGRSTPSSSEGDLPSLANGLAGETTIGEKIKKKSMLARYLSMVPHLFLRDCRISLILPEETMDDDKSMTSSYEDCTDECTVFELGIDFLSVTSGDDFLDVLRFDTGNQSTEGSSSSKPQSYGYRRGKSEGCATQKSGSERKNVDNLQNQGKKNNTFSRKRIRTGKGPDGGMWLKVYTPQGKMTKLYSPKTPKESKWARQHFLDSSESFFFRCSGIDLHARILTHTIENVNTGEEDEIGNTWSNELEDYTMDSMLFGVDYVDPSSLARHEIIKMRRESNGLADAANGTNSNDIQSIPYASNFHWTSQRTHRNDCENCHLPLNECFQCWNNCASGRVAESSLDNQMPLPGFVFCLSMTDPLEVNVDRNSVEALGYIKSLFTSKKPHGENESTQDETDANIVHEEATISKGDEALSNARPSLDFDRKRFPPYMQPDVIYLSGIHVSKIIIRFEAMQPKIGSGLKYRFWQFIGQSIHFEQSQVDCEEQFLQDVTVHVGSMECKDFVGVCKKTLLEAGMHSEAMLGEPCISESEVCLPCTASRVLGVTSPIPIDKRSYAAHLRLIRVPNDVIEEAKVGYVNLQIGKVDVDIGANLIGDTSKAFREAMSILSSGPKQTKKSNTAKSSAKPKLKWLYQLSTKGGTVSYQPKIKMKIPESDFQLRKGPEGFSFEILLESLGIKYGKYIFEKPTPPSVKPFCSLPESLRMHILLYLDDLTPLERVFSITKKKASTFLRTHALNKEMTKLSKSGALSTKKRVQIIQSEVGRRNEVMRQLQSLDIDSLEALLAMHHRSQKK